MKILIVDDNADDRRLLRYSLVRHGCEQVMEACDGTEGLEIARAEKPDVIVSDALMPRMDGFEFLRRAKKDDDLRTIPFVFHSSIYTGLRDKDLALSLGAAAFIAKPKAPDEFWEELAVVLKEADSAVERAPVTEPLAEERDYLRRYSGIVAAKLEEKVRELEESLARRKEAEEALRKSERFLNSIIENIPDTIVVRDMPQLRVVRINRAGEELLGQSREELTAGTEGEPFVHGTDLLQQKEREAIACGRSVDIPEETIVTRGRGARILHTKKIPILDENGTPQYLLGISEDITERKRLEEQFLQSQKMEAIGLLAGGLAHDFKNILTTIIGFSTLIQRDLGKEDPMRANADQILAAAERGVNLIQRLLSFGRKQVMAPSPVDLNKIILRVEKFLRRIIGEDVELKVVPAAEELTVHADSGQLEQVLMNLITNARDAMPCGGTLVIEATAVSVDDAYVGAHGYGKVGRYALLTVSDNGMGMDEWTLQRIFEPFFTTKEEEKGTGLGLSVVYGIIKQHSGYVDVQSEPGLGTTFRIYLPFAEREMAEEETHAMFSPRGGEIILLAEDDESVRSLAVQILEESGYGVIVAKNGSEAVQRFNEHRDEVQLLLFDLIMPKKNGREAWEEIRKLRPGVKALFVSGYTADMLDRKGLIEEGMEVVMKPISPLALLKRIRSTLDR